MTGYQSKKAAAQDKLEQEPVAFFNPHDHKFYWAKPTKITAPITVYVEPMPLYTTPPQRPWVGLTDEEMQAVVDAQLLVSNINVYFKAIEAKLKEKNNGT